MKLSDITAWLASEQDFRQGAALYAALGPSLVYKRLFALGANETTRTVLLRELRDLVQPAAPVVAPLPPEQPPVAPLVPAPAPESPARLPATADQVSLAALDELRLQLRQLRDERSHLHPQLTGKNVGKKARGGVAMRIVALTSEETRLKLLEAHVLAHGRLPGPVATAELREEGELRRRLQNRLSQRSKLKKQPERAADLAEVEAEILLIRSKLTS